MRSMRTDSTPAKMRERKPQVKKTDKTKSKGIVSWPKSDRPRERLLRHGPQVLTEAELVAILIRVGCQGTNAVELGRQIINRFGSLQAMMQAPLSAMQDIKGLGGAKAAQLTAALEIGRRATLPDTREKITLRKPADVVDYLTIRLKGLSEEHFRGLYLNRQSVLLEDALLATGTVDQARPTIRISLPRRCKLMPAPSSSVIITLRARRRRVNRIACLRKTCLQLFIRLGYNCSTTSLSPGTTISALRNRECLEKSHCKLPTHESMGLNGFKAPKWRLKR